MQKLNNHNGNKNLHINSYYYHLTKLYSVQELCAMKNTHIYTRRRRFLSYTTTDHLVEFMTHDNCVRKMKSVIIKQCSLR